MPGAIYPLRIITPWPGRETSVVAWVPVTSLYSAETFSSVEGAVNFADDLAGAAENHIVLLCAF